jgi:hypothetical protein
VPTLLEKMQAKLAQLEQGKKLFWKAKQGENRIRILPSWEGPDGLFYKEVPTHYGVGPNRDKVVICAGEGCPVCALVAKLSVSEKPKKQQRAERMTAQNRIIMNIVDLVAPDKALMWSTGESNLHELLTYAMDSDFQNFTDPKVGFNVVVRRKGEMLQTRWKVRLEPKPSKLDTWKTVKSQVLNLDERFKPLPTKKIKAIMRGEDNGFDAGDA